MLKHFKKKKNKCLVFLDVDGVLNKESDWRIKYSLDSTCVKAFGTFCLEAKSKYESVDVVLISTWRAGASDDTEDSRQLQALKAALFREGITISGNTPISQKSRQEEVEYYIRRHCCDGYIVIDDDMDLFSDPERINLYVPNYKTGLTAKDVKKALRLI